MEERRGVEDRPHGPVLLLLQEDRDDVVRVGWSQVSELTQQKEIFFRGFIAPDGVQHVHPRAGVPIDRNPRRSRWSRWGLTRLRNSTQDGLRAVLNSH